MWQETGVESNDSGKVAVLLGAGASVDAGLPVTSQLASQILARANSGSDPWELSEWTRVLNAVYGAMAGYQGLRGRDPQLAVNIETLISSLRLLQVRDDHEVAPFVGNWLTAFNEFKGSRFKLRETKQLVASIAEALDRFSIATHRSISDSIAQIAASELKPDLRDSFRGAERFVLRELAKILYEHGNVEYLEPIIDLARSQTGGLDVITLNYDLTVEAAALDKIKVNRGIDTWTPGEELSFPAEDRVLNLLKLHGSLDWREIEQVAGSYLTTMPKALNVVSSQDLENESRSLPWIVVGDRDKLGTDGPTLELNYAARVALRRSNHLVVVGYSFGDSHINALLRDWIAGDSRRTMNVLDVSFEPFMYEPVGKEGSQRFLPELIGKHARHQDSDGTALHPRVHLVEGRASDQLGVALEARPVCDPEPLVTVVGVRGEGSTQLELTWHGPKLHGAELHGETVAVNADGPIQRVGLSSPQHRFKHPLQQTMPTAVLSFPVWESNTVKTVYFDHVFGPVINLRIVGSSVFGGYNCLISSES